MSLNRGLNAALLAGMLFLAGCAPAAPVHPSADKGGPDTPLPKKTPVEVASSGQGDSNGGPAATGPMAEDLANADGMAGFEEVMKMTAPSTGNMDTGKNLFAQNCATCHGATGKGDGAAGAALDPPPRNLTVPGDYKYGHMELATFRTIKYGVEGSGMTGWDGRMTDDETWAVVHYVMSLQKG